MKRFISPQFWRVAGLLILDAIFFSITDPGRVPSAMLIIAFALLIATLYLCTRGILLSAKAYGLQLGNNDKRLAIALTIFGAVLLALRSVNQLSSHDILVVTPLAVVAYLYSSYIRTNQET